MSWSLTFQIAFLTLVVYACVYALVVMISKTVQAHSKERRYADDAYQTMKNELFDERAEHKRTLDNLDATLKGENEEELSEYAKRYPVGYWENDPRTEND
jgi:hypothetical protein